MRSFYILCVDPTYMVHQHDEQEYIKKAAMRLINDDPHIADSFPLYIYIVGSGLYHVELDWDPVFTVRRVDESHTRT